MIRKALIVLMLLVVVGLPQVLASTSDLRVFNTEYNTSGTRLDTCTVCHTTGANLDQYGMDMSNQTGTTEKRLTNIEILDSDGDGFSNIDEIQNLTFPGNPADTPASTINPLAALLLIVLLLIAPVLILTYTSIQMKELDLRKWHRNVGIVLAPLLILQAVSGVFLSLDWMLGYHQRVGEAIRAIPVVIILWDKLLVNIHYGFGLTGSPYHIALGIGLIWATVSGVIIHLRIRARKKRLKEGRTDN